LFSTVLRLLVERVHADEPLVDAGRLRALARKCVEWSQHAPCVWLARLEVERACNGDACEAWRGARRVVIGPGATGEAEREEWESDALKVWTWELDNGSGIRENEMEKELEEMLMETMGVHLRKIHDALSIRYVCLGDGSDRVDKLARRFMPSTAAWKSIFETLVRHASGDNAAGEGVPDPDLMPVLTAAHAHWRDAGGGADATVAWAEWLLDHGHGAEAVEAVGSGTAATRARWAEVLRARELDDVDNEAERGDMDVLETA